MTQRRRIDSGTKMNLKSSIQQTGQGETTPNANLDETVGGVWQQMMTAWQALTDWITHNETLAVAALGSIIGVYVILLLIRMGSGIVLKRMGNNDPTATHSIIARAIARISTPFILIIAIWLTARGFPLPDSVRVVMNGAFKAILIFQSAVLIQEILVSLLQRRASRSKDTGSSLANAIAVLKWLIIGAIWVIAFIMLLDTSGVQVTALIAGLGVGGIAIGLAAQGIFSDLFASLSILFDKPFKKGDLIVFGQVIGEVEEIGLRTTRIRSITGEQISVSNTDLISERIHNYHRLERRRHLMQVGVVYQTPADVIEKIPGWLREDLEQIDKLDVDRIHFHGFGDFSLNFEIVFYAKVREFPDFMDVRQAANLAIMRRFEKEGVEFAYPTQTLYVSGSGSGDS